MSPSPGIRRSWPSSPSLSPYRTLVGNLYLNKGDLATARKYYEQALAINPNSPIAAANLAWVLGRQGGNLDVALGLAQKAKQLLPSLKPSRISSAGSSTLRAAMQAQSPHCVSACKKRPSYPVYHYHLGMALLAGGATRRGQRHNWSGAEVGAQRRGRPASQPSTRGTCEVAGN